MPLDNRLIWWLHDNDWQRKLRGRDAKYAGMLVEQELKERQDAAQAALQKGHDEKMDAIRGGLEWSIKRGDRVQDGTVPLREFNKNAPGKKGIKGKKLVI